MVSFACASEDGVTTYLAVRTSDLDDIIGSDGDGRVTLTPCALNLPDREMLTLAAELSAPVRRQVVIVGTVVSGIWATGPLSGQPGPEPN